MAAKYNRIWRCSIHRLQKNPTLGTNTKSIGRRVAEIWTFEFFKMADGRHLGFDATGNGTVRSAVSVNPTLETNTKSIGRRVAEICPFEVFQNGPGRHLGFDATGNGAVRSAVPENPTLEPNMKGIG